MDAVPDTAAKKTDAAIGYTIINTAKPYPLVPWLTVFLILIAEASGGTIVFCLIRRRYDKLSEAHRAKADALWPLKWKTLLITVAVLLVTASLLAIVHQSLSWTDFVDGVPADTLEEVHEHDDKLWWWERGGADAPYLMYFEEQHRQAVTYMTAFDVGFAALLLLEIGGGFVGYFIAKQHRMPTAAQKQEAERAPENR